MRSLIRKLHLWVALMLFLPLMTMGLSGFALVLDKEFGEGPRRSTEHVPSEQSRSIKEIVQAASQTAGPGFHPNFYVPSEFRGGPSMVRFSSDRRRDAAQSEAAQDNLPQGSGSVSHRVSLQSKSGTKESPGGGPQMLRMQVWIDPVSLQTLEVQKGNEGVLQWIRRWHTNLLIEGPSGRKIVGWFGFGLLGLVLSGLVIWWPNTAELNQAFRMKKGRQGRALLLELHKTVGIWAVTLLLISSLTGIYLAFPDDFLDVVRKVMPARDFKAENASMRVMPSIGDAPVDMDAAVRKALAAVNGAHLRSLAIPQSRDQPFRVALGRNGTLRGSPDITVFVDPWTGGIINVRNPAQFSAGESLIAWLRPIHEGGALGWPWTVAILISGCLPAFFAATGISMWWLRKRARDMGSCAT